MSEAQVGEALEMRRRVSLEEFVATERNESATKKQKERRQVQMRVVITIAC